VHEGLLSTDEVDECISIEFNPVRAGFHGSQEVWTRDVLNLGVTPDMLIAKVPSKQIMPDSYFARDELSDD
jgi:lycopene cyclase CruP